MPALLPVLALAVILYVLGDTVTRGRLGAVTRGTGKGVARTGWRAGRAGARKSREEYAAFLRSEAAPLRRTRRTARVIGKPVGKGARASWRGAREGITEELSRLRAAVDDARAETERARVDAQDPARGATRGRLGHSFDVPPRAARTRPTPTPAPSPPSGADPEDPWHDPPPIRGRHSTPPTPAAPAATTRKEPTMTATTPIAGGPPVHVESVPAWLAACAQLAAAGQAVHEAGIDLGISPTAQNGLQDAVDILMGVSKANQAAYSGLVEAADGTPRGAEAVTVGQARSE